MFSMCSELTPRARYQDTTTYAALRDVKTMKEILGGTKISCAYNIKKRKSFFCFQLKKALKRLSMATTDCAVT